MSIAVRWARHHLIVQEFESDYVGPMGRASVKDLIQLHGLLSQGVPWRLQSLLLRPEGAEKFALVITNLARQLAALERYERRALARRKKHSVDSPPIVSIPERAIAVEFDAPS